MKKTAVEQAIELIKKDYEVNGRLRPAYVFQTLEQAKAMEKEQIKKAYLIGFLEEKRDFSAYHYYEDLSEQYYNETFKSE